MKIFPREYYWFMDVIGAVIQKQSGKDDIWNVVQTHVNPE